MKKSNLIWGVAYVLAGLACLLTALLTETKLDGMLWGFAGAGMGPGILMICQYFYWSSPKHRDRYEERLEHERIEMNDELKVKLRDRSGRYAYVFGLVTAGISMVVIAVLGELEVIEHTRPLVLYLLGYMLVQYAAGVVFFNHLLKQY